MTASTHHHVIQGVVVLFPDARTIIKLDISKSMKLCEVDSKIGNPNHALDLITVWVTDLNVRGQYTKHNLLMTNKQTNKQQLVKVFLVLAP